ncbi:XRE family transcriptional regulator [Helicobacter magdeburgensis]|uniref:XRE family transcriptional regulator n=1 Tax=Helicobacter magdeburgensis TaxID=471858 RepID=A0A4U8SZ06_9HELI|nr:helix-turn-helix transcriptional regulator [Helicobacter magdeburgensis]TLD92265.1 XRE family transcriptional regulator [Helicobacter magdeburgensis]
MEKHKIDFFEDIDKEQIQSFYHRIANNVARIRKEKGVSQLELSLAIGYKSVSLIAGAEAKYKNIHFNLEHLYKIAQVLQVDIKDFFDETN